MNTYTTDLLNSLIEIHNDRIEGYAKSVLQTRDPDLRNLFLIFQQNSMRCKADLVREILNIGGEPTEELSASGKLNTAWIDINAALESKNRISILDSCETVENIVLAAYKTLINNNWDTFSISLQVLINRQRQIMKADHDSIRLLLDKLLEHH